MSTSYGPPTIVTDGLVLYLDAANPRSYVSGSSNWLDISNNGGSGSITNPVVYVSASVPAIDFSSNGGATGASGFVRCGPRIKDAENITIGVWVKPNTVLSTQHIWWEGQSADGFGNEEEIHLSTKTFTNGAFTDYTIGVYGVGGSAAASLNVATTFSSSGVYSNVTVTLENMSGSITGVTGSLYVNGQLMTSSMSFLSRSLYSNDFRLGRATGTIRYFAGSVGAMVIYNKVLSPAEVAQNFNATRARFGV